MKLSRARVLILKYYDKRDWVRVNKLLPRFHGKLIPYLKVMRPVEAPDRVKGNIRVKNTEHRFNLHYIIHNIKYGQGKYPSDWIASLPLFEEERGSSFREDPGIPEDKWLFNYVKFTEKVTGLKVSCNWGFLFNGKWGDNGRKHLFIARCRLLLGGKVPKNWVHYKHWEEGWWDD